MVSEDSDTPRLGGSRSSAPPVFFPGARLEGAMTCSAATRIPGGSTLLSGFDWQGL